MPYITGQIPVQDNVVVSESCVAMERGTSPTVREGSIRGDSILALPHGRANAPATFSAKTSDFPEDSAEGRLQRAPLHLQRVLLHLQRRLLRLQQVLLRLQRKLLRLPQRLLRLQRRLLHLQ